MLYWTLSHDSYYMGFKYGDYIILSLFLKTTINYNYAKFDSHQYYRKQFN